MKLTSSLQKSIWKTFEVCEVIVIVIVYCNLLKEMASVFCLLPKNIKSIMPFSITFLTMRWGFWKIKYERKLDQGCFTWLFRYKTSLSKLQWMRLRYQKLCLLEQKHNTSKRILFKCVERVWQAALCAYLIL